MNEKRQFPRQMCNIPVNFGFYEGNPDEIDTESATPIKGKGVIVDISQGGAFLISRSRVIISMPINLSFSSKGKKYTKKGIIVRTGLLQNNPSEAALKYAGQKAKGDAYIALMFNSPLENIPT